MKRFLARLIFTVVLLPSIAMAQTVVVERWVEYRVIVINQAKALPAGFQHFTPVNSVAANMRLSSQGLVLCNSLESAISYGKRIAQGMTPDQTIEKLRDLRNAWDCKRHDKLVLTPLEVAVRGDNEGRRIVVMKVLDQNGDSHLMSDPLDN